MKYNVGTKKYAQTLNKAETFPSGEPEFVLLANKNLKKMNRNINSLLIFILTHSHL